MIDWNKPLVCYGFANPKLHLIGFTPDGCYAVLISVTGTLYKADVNTCKLIGFNSKVENQKEPWEAAWKEFSSSSDFDLHPYNYGKKECFQKGFEFGCRSKKQ
jgi:hypothetical protein